MAFWIFMLVVDLLIPLTMIGCGRMFLRSAPGKINAVFGYRTAMSMKNRDTWEFAHRYAGKIWYRWGWYTLLATAAFMGPLFGKDTDTVGFWSGIVCLVQCIPLAGVIYPTERALRRNFDKDGKKREVQE